MAYCIRTTDTHEILYFNQMGDVIFTGPNVTAHDEALGRIAQFDTIEVADYMLAYAIDWTWAKGHKLAGRPLHIWPSYLAMD